MIYFKSLVLLILIGGIYSCERQPAPELHYVFPDGYRGIAKIRLNQPSGLNLKNRNVRVLRFSSAGIVEVIGSDPITEWHRITVMYESGDHIDFDNNPSKDYPSDHVALHHLGYNKDKTESWYYLGTRKDARTAGEELHGGKKGDEYIFREPKMGHSTLWQIHENRF